MGDAWEARKAARKRSLAARHVVTLKADGDEISLDEHAMVYKLEEDASICVRRVEQLLIEIRALAARPLRALLSFHPAAQVPVTAGRGNESSLEFFFRSLVRLNFFFLDHFSHFL